MSSRREDSYDTLWWLSRHLRGFSLRLLGLLFEQLSSSSFRVYLLEQSETKVHSRYLCLPAGKGVLKL